MTVVLEPPVTAPVPAAPAVDLARACPVCGPDGAYGPECVACAIAADVAYERRCVDV